jgi:uncharacterized repeat protein (TIGR03806 family)
MRRSAASLALLTIASLGAAATPGLDTRPANPTCVAPARLAGTGILSADWLSADVGSVGAAGSTQRKGSSFTLRGSGADIWGTADEFRFTYRLLSGNGDLVARVTSLSGTDPWAKAGLMVRESLEPGARFALMMMTPGSNGASFQYRTGTGGNAAPGNSADKVSSLPRWLKISRRGNVVSGYLSADGATWTLRNSVSLALPATVHVGMAVTRLADGTLATGVFEAVQLQPSAGTPAPPTGYSAEDAFPSSPGFDQPTKLVQAPGDPGRWFVLEKTGRVRAFRSDTPAVVTTWLDFSNRVNANSEGGLLGMAFHPLFPARREVFVAYTTGSPMQLVVARLLLDNVTTPVAVTEQVLLAIAKPYENHNGGDLAFGPDGYLYVATGDGGGAGDPDNNAQNPTRLLGKILRVDAWDGAGWPATRYGIPPDNPWAGNPACGGGSNGAACPEVFALGLRNPWRFGFDPATGALWTGDVGQNQREEIHVISRGGNYGWRCREGSITFNAAGCPGAGFTAPVYDYPHAGGNGSVTGGYVYRGDGIPELRGRYLFGDYLSGRIWALRDDGAGGFEAEELVDTAAGISAFATGHDGELYLADYAGGRILRLQGSRQALADVVPDDLAATGCVTPANPRVPSGGMVPFSVNSPFWSDGASKTRHLAVPNGTTIGVAPDGDWQFPPGTVLMKTMDLGGTPVETRLLMRHPDGGWAGYTYEWNAAGTRATRVRGGKSRFISGQDWLYPSEGQCQQCHTAAAGVALGPETAQLNRDQTYPLTGRQANQLETLSRIGLLVPGIAAPATAPALPDPGATSRPLNERARSYLHANCSGCHRPGGPTGTDLDMRYTLPLRLAALNACDQPPQAGDLGIANARLLAPGHPESSVLLQRLLRRDAHGMPPVASSMADPAGAALVASWISSLPDCADPPPPAGDCVACHQP